MAKNIQPGFFEKENKWWQTDTGKAALTILAVLLIPGAVVAYNYFSQNAKNDNRIFGTNESSKSSEMNSTENTKENANGGSNSESKNTDVEQGELPNTSSTIMYTVREGDTTYSISQKLCGDDSFYNKTPLSLKIGEIIKVECD